jgi:hypothetical protein
VALRPEIYWDCNGRLTGSEPLLTAITTTVEYQLSKGWAGAVARLEYRYDESTGGRRILQTRREWWDSYRPCDGASVPVSRVSLSTLHSRFSHVFSCCSCLSSHEFLSSTLMAFSMHLFNSSSAAFMHCKHGVCAEAGEPVNRSGAKNKARMSFMSGVL